MSNKWKSNSFSGGASYNQYSTLNNNDQQDQKQKQQHHESHFQNYQQPKLVRASTLNLPTQQMLMNVPVTVDFFADINTVTSNWTESELRNSRRLVLIDCVQDYGHLSLQFKPIAQEDYVTGSTVLSCIYWKKTGRFYLTSVELISLLEHLVNSKFPVEEKNRIRRNLQSIKPLTISKSNEEYHELFDLIMNFSNPKPRRIEKDVKVIYWDHLKEALAKVLSKYIVDPTSSNKIPPPTPQYSQKSSSQQQQQPLQQQLQLQDPSQPRYFPPGQQQHHAHQPSVFFQQHHQAFPSQVPPVVPMYFVGDQQYTASPLMNYPGVSSSTTSFATTPSTATTSSSYLDSQPSPMLTSNPYHSDSILSLPNDNQPASTSSSSQSQQQLIYPLSTEAYPYHHHQSQSQTANTAPSSSTEQPVKREDSPSSGYFQQQHSSSSQYDYNSSGAGSGNQREGGPIGTLQVGGSNDGPLNSGSGNLVNGTVGSNWGVVLQYDQFGNPIFREYE